MAESAKNTSEKEPVVESATEATSTTSAAASDSGVKKSNKKLFIILGVVAVVVLLPAIIFFSLVAAGSIAFFNIASQSDQHLEHMDHDSMTFTDDEGNETTISDSAELAEDFPKVVPLYDGAKITASARTSNEDMMHWVVGVDTSDDMDIVLPKIKDSFNKDGWTVDSEYETNDGGYYTASHEMYEVSISFAPADGDGTDITYSVSEKMPM